jgi:hypothetical protein
VNIEKSDYKESKDHGHYIVENPERSSELFELEWI